MFNSFFFLLRIQYIIFVLQLLHIFLYKMWFICLFYSHFFVLTYWHTIIDNKDLHISCMFSIDFSYITLILNFVKFTSFVFNNLNKITHYVSFSGSCFRKRGFCESEDYKVFWKFVVLWSLCRLFFCLCLLLSYYSYY